MNKWKELLYKVVPILVVCIVNMLLVLLCYFYLTLDGRSGREYGKRRPGKVVEAER